MLNTTSAKLLLGLTATASTVYLIRIIRRKLTRQHQKELGTVVITGCDSGIGHFLALHFSSGENPRFRTKQVIATVLDRDGEAAGVMRGKGIKVVQLDLRNDMSIEECARDIKNTVENANSELDVLINNAGVFVMGEFWLLTEQQRTNQIQVNFTGPITLTHKLLPLLHRAKGRIINMCSDTGDIHFPSMAVYSASKAALMAWTKAIRAELRPMGIKAIMIIPENLALQTSILHSQIQHSQEMLTHIEGTPEKDLMGDLALKYRDHFVKYFSGPKPTLEEQMKTLEKDGQDMLNATEQAVTADRPKFRYECNAFLWQCILMCIEMMSDERRDALMYKLLNIPMWQPVQ